MNFLIVQHAEHIEAGSVVDWIKERGHRYKTQDAWLTEEWPPISDYDALIIMGGPMSAYDEENHPFLVDEKRFINEFISSGKPTFGICLGHQILAEILGGRVEKGNLEIGWHDVRFTKFLKTADSPPNTQKVFQWHGDVVSLPPGAGNVGTSEANLVQGFSLKNVFTVQFHPEVAKENIEMMIEHDKKDLKDGGKFVQSETELLAGITKYQTGAQKLFFDILDAHFRWLN
jgi:GMP synthase-like glutamine amidotransferase